MGVLLFYFELFIFGRGGSSLRRRHPSSCVELRPLKQGWVGFSGAALVGGAYWGVALLWAGLEGCCPLVGGAVGGTGFSSFHQGLGRCCSLEQRFCSWEAQA